MGKGVLVALFVIFGAGYGCGSHTASQPETIVKTVESPPQVITHVEMKEVIKPAPLPEDCQTLVLLLRAQATADLKIESNVNKIADAASAGASGIALRDISKLNAATQIIIDSKRELDFALVAKSSSKDAMETALAGCNKAYK